jgi:hypothetical protein
MITKPSDFKISSKDGQAILRFEDDSQWLFSGFFDRNGLTYMRVYKIRDDGSSIVPGTRPVDMYVTSVDYYLMVEILNELIKRRLHVKADPCQLVIESFLTTAE